MSVQIPTFPPFPSGHSPDENQFAERATPPLEQLEHGLAQTSNVLQEKAEQLHTAGEDWAESMRGRVREHPLVAVAAALAVGWVIARVGR